MSLLHKPSYQLLLECGAASAPVGRRHHTLGLGHLGFFFLNLINLKSSSRSYTQGPNCGIIGTKDEEKLGGWRPRKRGGPWALSRRGDSSSWGLSRDKCGEDWEDSSIRRGGAAH